MKGRKPKDLDIKILTGNPGKRPTSSGSDAAPFTVAPLKKPRGLDKFASYEWDRLVDTLAPILSPASAGMVLIAVDAYSQMMSASKALKDAGGMTYETSGKSGSMIRERPEVGMRDRARRAYHQALAELGASPVAHTRVKKLPETAQQEIPGIHRLLG